MRLKWTEIGTGGGCTALEALLPKNQAILMTAHDDPTVPRRGEAVSVGWYDLGGYNIDPPAWARARAENPNADIDEPLLFPNARTAKKVLADGYREL